MNSEISDNSSVRSHLSDAFGSYRAEWIERDIFDLFRQPGYFSEIEKSGNVVLTGGRGTGKTTALRALSWQGQQALLGKDVSTWSHLGVYIRIDTNQVTSMQGGGLNDDEWAARFAHYFNLILIERFAALAESCDISMNPDLVSHLSDLLPEEPSSNKSSLKDRATAARQRFRIHLNNLATAPPLLIPQGMVSEILASLAEASSEEIPIFVCIDEYENLLEYQQRVINTLVKHSDSWVSYKVGMRELGWRTRRTLNPAEYLQAPADYADVSIELKLSESFPSFAREILEQRLLRVASSLEQPMITDPSALLPRLDLHAEASLLGVKGPADITRQAIREGLPSDPGPDLEEMDDLRVYLLKYWADGHNTSVVDEFSDYLKRPDAWETRYGNYAHAALFTIRKRKVGHRKLYAGFDTYCALAGGNLRFLMQLVENCLLLHSEKSDGDLTIPVSPDVQTEAAIEVGRLNLAGLGGVSDSGIYLARMVLSLGFVFSALAARAEGHTPELNQFHFAQDLRRRDEDATTTIDFDSLIRDGIMSLALLRFHATKKPSVAETTDFDYQLHPIFSPFFMFSHRKKRKFKLTPDELLHLVERPESAVEELLGRLNRADAVDSVVPAQMALFSSYLGRDIDA